MPDIKSSTRPEGVKVTTALMTAILIAELALSLYTMHRVAAALAGSTGGFRIPSVFSGTFSFISILIAAVFVFFYWQGQNVARWAVLIDSGLVILSALGSLFTLLFVHQLRSGLGLGPAIYLGSALNLLKACLAGYFFWYLNQPEVKVWFLRSGSNGGTYAPAGYVAPYAQQPPTPYPAQATSPEAPTPEQPPTPPPPGFTV